ncbi:hypothetical protein HX109_10605 [Galbibacter sp. BG1]|uniref:WD40 repeat domain-containing protein n=1 Tax=Galbibacter sp. BG1 TaxID=1170699 RepID=UPI0015BD8E2F|nr:hypothetical protein [Galbibacter sp. BG1]QLE01980.1 hypothetical protein HX109_10605 [Galbibacter sp. BG1]
MLQKFIGHGGEINQAEFSPNGQNIITASKDTKVKLWNLDSTLIQTLNKERRSADYTSATFSRDDKFIIMSTPNHTAEFL